MVCILILGGARSGKSRFAQELASQFGEEVLFVATGSPLDEEMRQRIEEHRKNRPGSWRTLEVSTNAGKKIADSGKQVVVLDCITLLINNVIEEHNGENPKGWVSREIEELIECIDKIDGTFIIVSNEVGMGIVPASKLGRTYRDLLGWANQELAKCADEVYLMIAGIKIKIKP